MTINRKNNPKLSKQFTIKPLTGIEYVFTTTYTASFKEDDLTLRDVFQKHEFEAKFNCYKYFIRKFKENNITTYWMKLTTITYLSDTEDIFDQIVNRFDLNFRIDIFLTSYHVNYLKIYDYDFYHMLNNNSINHITEILE